MVSHLSCRLPIAWWISSCTWKTLHLISIVGEFFIHICTYGCQMFVENLLLACDVVCDDVGSLRDSNDNHWGSELGEEGINRKIIYQERY